MSRRLALVLLALLMPAALLSQTTSKNMMAGTWKLDTAKSKFEPGPGPTSATVDIADDGTIKYQEQRADGNSVSWSVKPNADGSPSHIDGMGENDTMAAKSIDDRHTEHMWKVGGGSMTGKAVLSKNGKTMTYTLTGTNSDGTDTHNVEVFEKQ